jgi:GNAT superfamily N-acetyltransferase
METLPPASAPLKVSPSFTVALLEMERDARRAELALRGVLAKAPRLAEAHYHLGVLRLRRGDGIGARLCFRSALAALRSHGGDEPPWTPSLRVLLKELG